MQYIRDMREEYRFWDSLGLGGKDKASQALKSKAVDLVEVKNYGGSLAKRTT